MANAHPTGEEIQYWDDDLVDSEEDENAEAPSVSGSAGKQNGEAPRVSPDRYGFVGGDQYTDPMQ